jgi:hypothetical protein
MVYVHALAGDSKAARFLSPDSPQSAPQIAYDTMKLKLSTYLQFNATFPGFGGYLPWFLADSPALKPTYDWVNRVPALDNGELIWAVYAAVHVLETSSRPDFQALAKGWQAWLDYTKLNAARVFYAGNGRVCAVTTIRDQSLSPTDPGQHYQCEGSGTLNDPYEGELFTWWLYFFGGLSPTDKKTLLSVKLPQLVRSEYHLPSSSATITVQRGFWFSAHEQWKTLEMPYLDIPLVSRLFLNGERARTCNSALSSSYPTSKPPASNPGMFASVNNSTDSNGQIIGYISAAGIPSIASQTQQELDVITPYSVFPVMLFDRAVGFAWWRNMAAAKGMQNPYGSTESSRIDGTAISAFVSWDSKISTVVAYLGGVAAFSRAKMQKEGLYGEFISITQDQYSHVFGDKLNGEDVSLCLPKAAIPDAGVMDFTACAAPSKV